MPILDLRSRRAHVPDLPGITNSSTVTEMA
jgi:hypothetical protein